jgi:hypothetical protein
MYFADMKSRRRVMDFMPRLMALRVPFNVQMQYGNQRVSWASLSV